MNNILQTQTIDIKELYDIMYLKKEVCSLSKKESRLYFDIERRYLITRLDLRKKLPYSFYLIEFLHGEEIFITAYKNILSFLHSYPIGKALLKSLENELTSLKDQLLLDIINFENLLLEKKYLLVKTQVEPTEKFVFQTFYNVKVIYENLKYYIEMQAPFSCYKNIDINKHENPFYILEPSC